MAEILTGCSTSPTSKIDRIVPMDTKKLELAAMVKLWSCRRRYTYVWFSDDMNYLQAGEKCL